MCEKVWGGGWPRGSGGADAGAFLVTTRLCPVLPVGAAGGPAVSFPRPLSSSPPAWPCPQGELRRCHERPWAAVTKTVTVENVAHSLFRN